MAQLSGHLSADFSSFTTAVEGAQVTLKGFESDAGKVGISLTKMTESLSGTKVIQEAMQMAEAIKLVGGAANLTEQEIAKFNKVAGDAATKLKGMGKDVPEQLNLIQQEAKPLPSLFGEVATVAAGMFTLDAIMGFTKQVMALGSEIKTLALQTGVTYDEMQQLMHIADQTNTPIETLTKGIQTLQLRVGDENSGASASLKRLGINLDDFKKADPQKQLYMVADALGAITDESKFATEANALFGGSWRTMAPALKSDMEETGKAASTMTKGGVEGINSLSDAISAGWSAIVSAAGSGIGETVQLHQDFYNELTTGAKRSLDTYYELADAIKKIAPAWDLMARAGNGLKLTQDELNTILTTSNRELDASIKKNKELKDAQDDIASAGTRWTDTVRGMNTEMVTAVKGYLEAGVSQRSLAVAYNLTNTEIRALTEAVKAEHLAIEAVNRLWGEYGHITVEQTGTATDAAIADIERWASETARRMREAGADTVEFYEALAELTHAKMNDVLIDWQALADGSQETYARNLEQIAQKAEATFARASLAGSGFSVTTIQRFGEAAQAARDAADHWQESWVEAGTEATTAVEKTTTATTQAFQRMQTTIAGGAGAQMGTSSKGSAPINLGEITYAGGIQQAIDQYTRRYGTGSAAGLMGGGSNLPDFTTWALSMGLAQRAPTVTNTFNIVDTESGIARRVGDTITSQIQRGSLVN